MVNDSISDALTRLRNAHLAQKSLLVLKENELTKVTKQIFRILLQEGFLSSIENTPEGLKIELKRSVKTFKRVSSPGVRIYANHKELPKVLNGMGIALISTSKGILTDKQARNLRVGGEILCFIW